MKRHVDEISFRRNVSSMLNFILTERPAGQNPIVKNSIDQISRRLKGRPSSRRVRTGGVDRLLVIGGSSAREETEQWLSTSSSSNLSIITCRKL